MSKMKNKQVFINGIKFMSKVEGDFYLHLLKLHNKEDIELQPKFLLQPGFKKNGVTHRSITYIADFAIKNTSLIYDVKGHKTTDFIIKHKMFEYLNQDKHLILITRCPKYLRLKYGDWIELSDLKKEQKLKK